MNGDPDFDLYDDGSFDEAFLCLIDNLKNLGNGTQSNDLVTTSPREDESQTAVPHMLNDESKVPEEMVYELNHRISRAMDSPFDRFRIQRGTLSVRSSDIDHLTQGDRHSWARLVRNSVPLLSGTG